MIKIRKLYNIFIQNKLLIYVKTFIFTTTYYLFIYFGNHNGILSEIINMQNIIVHNKSFVL